jgi:hypothetical protein
MHPSRRHGFVAAALLAVVATTSAATSLATSATATARSTAVIPACEELLSKFEAGLAMDEKKVAVVRRDVVGSTRQCDWIGGSSAVGHTLEVDWGPYDEFRKRSGSFRKSVCSASKGACRTLATATTQPSNLRSFYALEKALAQVGRAHLIDSQKFEHNPTILWLPNAALTPLDQFAWVFVYIAKSAHMLEVGCTDSIAKDADSHCALDAAGFAEGNV